MSNELIIDVKPTEIAIALLENKQLLELNNEKSNLQFSVGDIYLGKVKKVMPGLNAAFVDVGYEKDAFLHYLDLGPQFQSLNKYLNTALSRKAKFTPFSKQKLLPDIDKGGKISDVLSVGQNVIVQVAKEPISTKGPRLTSEISLAGRNIVLMPFSDKVSISQKIESAEERQRLKTLIISIKPKNYGIIVRTVAETKKVAVLDAELRTLVKRWESAFEKIRGATPPKLVIGELSRTSAILRDILNVSFNHIHVNDRAIFEEAKAYLGKFAPEKQDIVKLFKGKRPIFEHFGIDKQIKSLFGRTVSFKNGAYLIIEHTEALHVVDVNSGNRSKSAKDQETTALEVNLAAASEISRQLRLRDIGGIIVVDFIDMQLNEHRQMLFDRMKETMAKDRTKHSILPLSKFGLMQITRQRVRPEMNIDTLEKCPTCKGSGEIAPAILFNEKLEDQIAFVIREYNLRHLLMKVHPYVASFLKRGLFSYALKWSLKYKCNIRVEESNAYSYLEYHLFDKYGEEILF